jgi:hypothetical protein
MMVNLSRKSWLQSKTCKKTSRLERVKKSMRRKELQCVNCEHEQL